MCLSLSCLAKKSSFGHRPLPSSTINRFVFRLVRLEVHNLTPLVTWPNSVRHATTHCPSLSKAKVRVSHMTPSCDWNSSRPLSFNLLAPYEHIFFLTISLSYNSNFLFIEMFASVLLASILFQHVFGNYHLFWWDSYYNFEELNEKI